MLNQTVHVDTDGTVTYGAIVPHEAANIPCFQALGERVDPESGIRRTVRCKRRAGHRMPKGVQPHVTVDIRYVAAPPPRVHTERFKPNLIPGGVNQSEVPIPHDCANHLSDTQEVLRRGW